MTRQHFEWFAQWIAQHPNLTMDYDALDSLMWMFAEWNENFNPRKFLLACGFDEEEVTEIWGYRDE